jgi:hypothetical protein
LPEGVEMVMPGDNIRATLELLTPIALDPGQPSHEPVLTARPPWQGSMR